MKVNYILYSDEHPKGTRIIKGAEAYQMATIEENLKKAYNSDQYKVTVKIGRHKERHLTGLRK